MTTSGNRRDRWYILVCAAWRSVIRPVWGLERRPLGPETMPDAHQSRGRHRTPLATSPQYVDISRGRNEAFPGQSRGDPGGRRVRVAALQRRLQLHRIGEAGAEKREPRVAILVAFLLFAVEEIRRWFGLHSFLVARMTRGPARRLAPRTAEEEGVALPPRLHAGGAAGGHCDHRDLDRCCSSGRSGGPEAARRSQCTNNLKQWAWRCTTMPTRRGGSCRLVRRSISTACLRTCSLLGAAGGVR